jgi:ubiquinol-cytochrome c reductase cytochrome b subunit
MVGWLGDHIPDTDEEKATRRHVVLALSSQAALRSQAEADRRDSAQIALGIQYMRNTTSGCAECHNFQDVGTDSPVLTGWASREWMVDFVNDPSHVRYFGRDNDRMPSYGKEKSLTQREIEMVVDWIRQEWYVPTSAVARK